ncbi:MAG TPA: hypothetical protein VJR22_05390 [Candidatus Nitrosotalea sp.]|nr:hypothetical protein [Candidatus Nitrosotalea sp.]
MTSRLLQVLSFIILISLLQCIAFAQEESAPQIRLSSKGLAYVELSTSPSIPVSGQPTIILLQFLDPQTKAPRGDIYYKLVIRNSTEPVFVMPGGSTIAGKVGIPYQFDNPGNYQVEIDLNDTDISKSSAGSLDEVTFPVYIVQGVPQEDNQTSLDTTVQNSTIVNTDVSSTDNSHVLIDGILVVVAAGLIAFIVRRKIVSKQSKDQS